MMIRATTLFGIALVMFAMPVLSAEPSEMATPALGRSADKSQPETPPAKAAAAPATRTPDRLDLDVSIVTGNRELPKVLYIVPWKKAELGDLPDQPFNSLLDEALKPVDRDEFRREVVYFSKLEARSTATEAANEGKSPIAPTASR